MAQETVRRFVQRLPAEHCPICLENIEDRQRSRPDACDHQFCFDCLDNWSSKTSACPLCRVHFTNIITVRDHLKFPLDESKLRQSNGERNRRRGQQQQQQQQSNWWTLGAIVVGVVVVVAMAIFVR